MKKSSFTSLVLGTLLAASCTGELTGQDPSGATFSVEAAEAVCVSDTKSAFFDESDKKITNLNIWVYDHTTGLPVNFNADGSARKDAAGYYYETFFTTPSDIDGDLLFPDYSATYDVFLLTNVDKVDDKPLTLSAAKNYVFKFDSYDTFTTLGFPMAAVYSSFVPDTGTRLFTVNRLVSKYIVKLTFNGTERYDFRLKEAKIVNSAADIKPFAKESSATAKLSSDKTDRLSAADVMCINGGNGAELYLLENTRRNIFQGQDKRDKKYLRDQDKDLTSYLSFTGEVKKKDATGWKNVTCNYYFGTGTDAYVPRAMNQNLNLTLVSGLLDTIESADPDNSWKVIPADPFDNRVVRFEHASLTYTVDNQADRYTTVRTYDSGTDKENSYIGYTLSLQGQNTSTTNISGIEYREVGGTSWKAYSGGELKGAKDVRLKMSKFDHKETVKLVATVSETSQASCDITVMPSLGTGKLYYLIGDDFASYTDLRTNEEKYVQSYEFVTGCCAGAQISNFQFGGDQQVYATGDYARKYAGMSYSITFWFASEVLESLYYDNINGGTYINLTNCKKYHINGADEYFLTYDANNNSASSNKVYIQSVPFEAAWFEPDYKNYVGIQIEFENNDVYWVKFNSYKGEGTDRDKYSLYLTDEYDCYFIDIDESCGDPITQFTYTTQSYNTVQCNMKLFAAPLKEYDQMYMEDKWAIIYGPGVYNCTYKFPQLTVTDNMGKVYNLPESSIPYDSGDDSIYHVIMILDPSRSPEKDYYNDFLWEYTSDNKKIKCVKNHKSGNDDNMKEGDGKCYINVSSAVGGWHVVSVSPQYSPYYKVESKSTPYLEYYERLEFNFDH